MPGIAGLIESKENRRTLEPAVKAMAEALDHTSCCVKEFVVSDGAAMAAVRPDVYSVSDFTAEDNDHALAFWGQVWDMEDLLKRSGEGPASMGRLLLGLYRKEGLKGFQGINGRFTIAIWDKREKALRLVSDRHGFSKLFYRVTPGRLFFASEYKAIVLQGDFRKDIDEEAIADFMALGYCLGDKTFFKEIKLLPHGSTLTFRGGKLSIERYWDYSFRDGLSPLLEVDEYIDEYYRILKRAIERQTKGKRNLGLPLSGGLDSRTIAGMLKKNGFEGTVNAFSYGNTCSFDVIYGKSIADKLDYPFTYLEIDWGYLKDRAESFVWLTEGTVNCLNSHMMLPHSLLKEKRVEAVLTGFLGDTVGGEAVIGGIKPYKETFENGDFIRTIFNSQIDIMNDAEAGEYFREGFHKKVRDVTFERYRDTYIGAPSDNRYFKSVYAEMTGRQRRYTSFNLYSFEAITEVLSPFADNEFVDFALRIPDVLAFNRFTQVEMIKRHLKRVASVPWNKTELPLNASYIAKGLNWRLKRLVKNPLVRALVGEKYLERNDNYLNTNTAIKTDSKDFVVSHIKDNPFLAEYFRMDKVNELFENHMSGRKNEYGKITALLTLSLWHELFVEGKENPGQAQKI